jgi:hypothetical protein
LNATIRADSIARQHRTLIGAAGREMQRLSAQNMDPRLQPLRIPAGWTVAYSKLHEIDPADVPDDRVYWFLDEDLLQMRHERFNRLLDVGWYPSGNVAEGAYRLVVYEGDFHGKLLFEHCTASRTQMVAEVERLLEEVSEERL